MALRVILPTSNLPVSALSIKSLIPQGNGHGVLIDHFVGRYTKFELFPADFEVFLLDLYCRRFPERYSHNVLCIDFSVFWNKYFAIATICHYRRRMSTIYAPVWNERDN